MTRAGDRASKLHAASPALISAVCLVALYLIYTLVLRVWCYVVLARADGVDYDPLGPPFSLPFVLGEELVLGAVLALVLALVWRFTIARHLWLVVVLAYLLLLAADQMAFKVYFTHWDYVLYSDSHDAGAAWGSIRDLMDGFFAIDAILALALVVAVALPFRPRLVRSLADRVARYPYRTVTVAVLYLALTVALGRLEEQHGFEHSFPVAFASSYLEVRAEERELEQAVSAHSDSTLKIPPKLRSSGAKADSASARDAGPDDPMAQVRSAIAASQGKLNVVWYLMESTSYRESSLDPTNEYDTTPFIEELAGKSLLFTDYYCGVAASTRSFFSAMTGIYPYVDKTSDLVKYSRAAAPSLVDIAHEAGYKTAFFASSDTLFDSLDSYIAAKPYDVYLDKNLLPAEDRPGGASGFWGVPEEIMIDKALEWIASVKDSGAPFFLNYNAVYPHHPFQVPKEHAALYDMDWGQGKVRPRYRATLRYADLAVRRMYEGLERLGVLDDTLFIVTPDHGETFGDLHPKNHIHAEYCYDEDSHIFLVLHNPQRLGAPLHSRRLGSHTDLLPTILDILGLQREIDIDGQSLLAADWEEPRIFCYSRRQLGVRDGKHKYVFEKRRNRSELYDLSTDPGEQTNIAAEHPELVAEYKAAVKQWRVDVTRGYRRRVAEAGLSDREIGSLAGKRRQELFAKIRVLFDGASLCGGGACANAGSSKTFGKGVSLSVKATLKKKSSAAVKLDVYSPKGKRVHKEIVRLKGDRSANFAPFSTAGLEVGARYHVRVTTVVYHAVHDTRAFYFRLTE